MSIPIICSSLIAADRISIKIFTLTKAQESELFSRQERFSGQTAFLSIGKVLC